jgi:hypothetical protein
MDYCFGRKDYAVTGYDVNLTRYVNVVWGVCLNPDFIAFNFRIALTA